MEDNVKDNVSTLDKLCLGASIAAGLIVLMMGIIHS